MHEPMVLESGIRFVWLRAWLVLASRYVASVEEEGGSCRASCRASKPGFTAVMHRTSFDMGLRHALHERTSLASG